MGYENVKNTEQRTQIIKALVNKTNNDIDIELHKLQQEIATCDIKNDIELFDKLVDATKSLMLLYNFINSEDVFMKAYNVYDNGVIVYHIHIDDLNYLLEKSNLAKSIVFNHMMYNDIDSVALGINLTDSVFSSDLFIDTIGKMIWKDEQDKKAE